jgi:hypothetical protein
MATTIKAMDESKNTIQHNQAAQALKSSRPAAHLDGTAVTSASTTMATGPSQPPETKNDDDDSKGTEQQPIDRQQPGTETARKSD